MDTPMEILNGKDANTGRFAPGNKLSPGNPNARRMHELRKSVLEAGTEEDIQAVIRKMAEMGKGGDVMAARCYLEYVVGKPTQAIELSNADGSAIELPSIVATIMVALGDDPAARAEVGGRHSSCLRPRRLPRLPRVTCLGKQWAQSSTLPVVPC